MAHEVETMMSVREVPWHGLGTIVQEVQTAKEALISAGLDWEVDLYPLFARLEKEGREIPVPDQFAVVRDSDFSTLGVVGKQYVPIQNWKSFEFFDTLVDSGDAKYETAGSLSGGRVVFMTARVPKDIKIGGEDKVDSYLVLSTSHDGSMAFRAAVTPVRVVCMNTLNYGLQKATQSWSIRHTESADGKVEEARKALGLTFEYLDEFAKEAEALLAQEFTKAEFERLVAQIVPSKGSDAASLTQKALIGTLESSSTIDDGMRYTKWGAMNAVAEYVDWVQPIQNSKTKTRAEQRTERAWWGPGLALKKKAHAVLTGA